MPTVLCVCSKMILYVEQLKKQKTGITKKGKRKRKKKREENLAKPPKNKSFFFPEERSSYVELVNVLFHRDGWLYARSAVAAVKAGWARLDPP